MLCDADDCVSNRLALHAASHPGRPGWYFDEGWMYDDGSRLVFKKRRDFDAVCGTSSIVWVTSDDLPMIGGTECDADLIWRSGHAKIRANSIARGTPLESLPFAGAVYILATGENDSGFSLRGWRSKKVLIEKFLSYRLLTKRFEAEFGLFQPLSSK